MFISEAAERAGVNIQTLRYYEKRGLLPEPHRRESGYREYGDDAVQVVRFIKRAQDLGFSLDEVADLMRLRGVSRSERHRVRALAEQKVADIDRRLAHLQAMRQALSTLVDCCRSGHDTHCPIIEALTHD